MAETYGRLTGKAGVCSATLGPGAINLLLGVADALTNSTPLVALSAQVGMQRSFKESHQGVDLVSMFAPVTKWSALMATPGAAPEMIRKAFKLAQAERPGAVYLAIPEDVEEADAPAGLAPLRVNVPWPGDPSATQVARAAQILREARNPVVLAGHGAARAGASAALIRFAQALNIPVSTTFHGKGVFPDDHPLALGTVGFMRHDYVNFGFDRADVIVAVGYELQEFNPVRVNPDGAAKIIHVHQFPAEVDNRYDVAVGLVADISHSLDALAAAVWRKAPAEGGERIRELLTSELDRGRADARFPLHPAPTTCLISTGLSTMAWTVPGAIGAKIARPEAKVLVATGDGSFLMNSQEIETALRMRLPFVILIWVDDAYGLISWKMDMEIGRNVDTRFANPDFVAYAESFGARGYWISAADELRPVLEAALADDTVSVIACPVDYSANAELIRSLGDLDESLS